jgi:mannose/fructose/N-acetylgalactosamine-specific phosphotransferase system component IIC
VRVVSSGATAAAVFMLVARIEGMVDGDTTIGVRMGITFLRVHHTASMEVATTIAFRVGSIYFVRNNSRDICITLQFTSIRS